MAGRGVNAVCFQDTQVQKHVLGTIITIMTIITIITSMIIITMITMAIAASQKRDAEQRSPGPTGDEAS